MLRISMVLKNIQRNPFAFWHPNNFSSSCQYSCSRTVAHNPTKLVSSLFKSGRIADAQKLFDKMPHKTIVWWSISIHGYAINGFHQKSMILFSQMRKSGLVPNSFIVVGVLVATGAKCDFMLARSVHGLIVKSGFESDLIVGTAMLDTYAKCGNVLDSYKVFEELKKPGLVSCSAILAGFINNGLCEEGIRLFEKFRDFGLVPNEAIMLTLIRGCVALEMRMLCESTHGLIIKLGLPWYISVNNAVLYMYSSLMDLSAATKVFDGMECKDVISWTTMIGLLVDLEYAIDALKLFSKMRDGRAQLDTVVLMHLISSCASLGDLKRGIQVHAQAVVCGFGSEPPLANSIITMYSKCADLDSLRTVFDQMTEKSLVSWTAVISGCVQNGCPREALNLVIKARLEENFSLDSIMLVSALTASSELAALEFCQQLHCYALEAGFSRYKSVQNSLISAYSKCGNVDLAHIVFKEIGYLQDIVSWNAIINGYGVNGHGETALALYHEMRKDGDNPDSATYQCILSACSHAGLVNDGLMIFNQMVEDNKIKPSQEHYGCVIDLLMRAGCLSDASWFAGKFLKEMGPDVWKALLSGCALHGNVVLAELAVKKVFEQGAGEPGQVVLLSNLYASVGRYQDAAALRLSMQNKSFIKNPGISFLNGIS